MLIQVAKKALFIRDVILLVRVWLYSKFNKNLSKIQSTALMITKTIEVSIRKKKAACETSVVEQSLSANCMAWSPVIIPKLMQMMAKVAKKIQKIRINEKDF
jgi:hypothetical protein